MQNLILSFKKELGVQNEKLVIHIYVVFIVLFLQNNFTDDCHSLCTRPKVELFMKQTFNV